MENIVIIGAGQAGFAAAAKLRKQGYSGNITMFGDEGTAPYQRPPLSKKYMLGEMELERLLFRPESYYADENITLVLNKTVSAIDPAAKTITVDGAAHGYDHLLITTGSTPRRLPAQIGGDLEGIYVMRDLADADAMAPEMQDGRRLLIIGGGYIGLEAAAVAAQKGLKVILIEMAPRILQRVAAEQTSDYFRTLHGANGVDIRENTGLTRLVGENGRVTAAQLNDGSMIDCDFVIAGIGVTPNDQLAADAGLTIDNGIAVNEFGQTSDNAIWSAGDCASFPLNGERVRLESVQNAIDQAENIAVNIIGENTPYTPSIWFWSDQYETKLQIAGLNRGYNVVATRKGETDQEVSYWYYQDSTLIAVDAMNDPRAYMVAKRLIDMGKSPAPEVVENPETNLKALLKA
jgi:3-phenylpropionate/trans-cinnamate dioxygenase ferredoxin reductase subunit